MIDLSPVFRREKTLAEIGAPITKQDLIAFTNEILDTQRAIIAEATDADVVFVPVDPQANDANAAPGTEVQQAWTLGHVVVHATAGSEEGAATALTLARSVQVEGRSRYETPWERVTSVAQVVQRYEESRKMRLAMLDAWPEQPDLANSYTPTEVFGPMNAVARFLLGLAHEQSHLEQLREIMRQAKQARGAN